MCKFLVAMLLFALASLSAREVNDHDRIVAYGALYDTLLSVASGYLAQPSYGMPGCTLMTEHGGSLPDTLNLTEADPSTYLGRLPVHDETSIWKRMRSEALDPLGNMAREYLVVHDWQKGDACLTGTVDTVWPQGENRVTLVAKLLAGRGDGIRGNVDVTITGRRLYEAVHVTGVIRPSEDGLDAENLLFEAFE